MKKFFLGLFVILFSATVANAQKSGFENARQLLNKKTAKTSLKANKAPSRISLESDERILGYYTTDDLDLTGGSSLGMNTAPGVYPVSVVFTPDVIGNFVGGQITKVRFGLSEPVGPSSVYVATIDINSGVMSEHLAEARLETTASGWNDVTFDTPVTIEPNTSYLISYEYAQESTYSMGQYIANNYPLLVDGSVNPGGETQYGFMIYGDFGQGTDWYTMTGQGYGNLCVQAVVKGGTFIDEDITLDGMSAVNTYCKNGEEASFTFGIKSNGNIIPSSYTLDVAVDGNVVSTLDTPVPLSNSIQQVSAGVTLPEGLSAGSPYRNARQSDESCRTVHIDVLRLLPVGKRVCCRAAGHSWRYCMGVCTYLADGAGRICHRCGNNTCRYVRSKSDRHSCGSFQQILH